MNAKKLLKKLGFKINIDHKIEGITDNYKEVKKNYIYIGKEEYYLDAIKNGAKTIIIEDNISSNEANIIYTADYRNTLAKALYYYNYNKISKLKIIGVTGTNAKTTTSLAIYYYLKYINIPVMYIGSNGVYYNDIKIKTNNTTLGIIDLYKYLNLAYKNNIKYISMELSSIGIDQRRIHKIFFDILIFTNITQDHLDYHKNIYNYRFSKMIPFIEQNKGFQIINSDDSFYKEIMAHSKVKYYTYGINNNSDYKIDIINKSLNGSTFNVNNITYHTNLIGSFNIYNLLPTIIISNKLFNNKKISEFIFSLNMKEGRMNLYNIKNYNIIIDYAHTASSVSLVLSEISTLINSRLFIICGCGGNREKEKRSEIGKILSKYENVLLTTDNPRNENPLDIINDINKDINPLPYIIDRKEAIYYQLNKMNINDYLIILGKGNEDYMEINNKRIHFNDLEVVNEYFS